MRWALYYFACGAVLLGTFWGGWLHGNISNRWGADAVLQRAANRLQEPFGSRIGNWRLVSENPFSEDVVQSLQCPAHFCGSYSNDQTGDTVNVAMMVGPPGPISVHTPELCYSRQGYHTRGQQVVITIRDRGGQAHTLWDLSLQSNDVAHSNLRVMYAWSVGGPWLASESPRFQHAGAGYLYKIQVAAELSDRHDDFDPCRDFLETFLFESQRHMIEPNESASNSIEYDLP